jgi:mono/diheme cytochrome c family protein
VNRALFLVPLAGGALGLLAAVEPVRAGCQTYSYPAATYSYAAPVSYQVVEKVKVVKQEVPVAVYVPLYTAVYAPALYPAAPPAAAAPAMPPAAPAAPAMPEKAPCADQTARLLSVLEGLDARLKRLEGNGGALPPLNQDRPVPPAHMPVKPDNTLPAPQAQAPLTAAHVFGTKCSQCHDAKVAKEKGRGFVLGGDGKLATLSDRQLRKVLTQIATNKMPPKDSGIPPLTEQEMAAVVNYVETQK